MMFIKALMSEINARILYPDESSYVAAYNTIEMN